MIQNNIVKKAILASGLLVQIILVAAASTADATPKQSARSPRASRVPHSFDVSIRGRLVESHTLDGERETSNEVKTIRFEKSGKHFVMYEPTKNGMELTTYGVTKTTRTKGGRLLHLAATQYAHDIAAISGGLFTALEGSTSHMKLRLGQTGEIQGFSRQDRAVLDTVLGSAKLEYEAKFSPE